MASTPSSNLLKRAEAVARTFRVASGIYILGSLERGVTVYSQQVRAHNLVWALWELSRAGRLDLGRVAILGGGITGLTAAACMLSRIESASIALFERRWDVCPFQQGSDTRWLHPRIYDWPNYGSKAPNASLPVLNWSEGRASDVARDIIKRFGKYCATYGSDRLRIYLGLSHLRIHASAREIEWMGRRTSFSDSFFQLLKAEGDREKFDTIILAPGFGLEVDVQGFLPTVSYWRNDQLGQPVLNGTRQMYVVSGFGDGGLIDLCRLTIERFRQDTILYELFGEKLEEGEELFRKALKPCRDRRRVNILPLVNKLPRAGSDLLKFVEEKLARRIRKDTHVVLHASGENDCNTSLADIFGSYSSFLNKLLLYLLYRCGAFTLSFETLEETVKIYQVPLANVLPRHGPKALANVLDLFTEEAVLRKRFKSMQKRQEQSPEIRWEPGCFPHIS
jgi:FAD dependent oxidoreductase